MKFVAWLVLGLLLGPTFIDVPYPSIFQSLSQIAGGIFLFFAGWELRFLNMRKDLRFYGILLAGSFVIPWLAGYFLLGRNLFLALAMAISALPVSIQILKEKNLFHTDVGRRTITLASICDVIAWLLFLFLLPKNDVASWIVSHWIVLAFFVGLLVGRWKPLKDDSLVLKLQLWLLAPLFFVGLGWKLNIAQDFSFLVFIEFFVVAVVAKGAGSYLFSRWAGKSHRDSLNMAALLNARGAMEILAAHYAYRSDLISASQFAALVLIGVGTAALAVPLVRKV
ncbi:cation:proton antiporter [Bdellovibrio bacteriovorus]|uniref:cation:proton antiporter n=1 Tax=Bdellovibrio bacteriovorus TaxID=959 RepID=UPI0035A58F7C